LQAGAVQNTGTSSHRNPSAMISRPARLRRRSVGGKALTLTDLVAVMSYHNGRSMLRCARLLDELAAAGK
jgi:hypothetical protein